MSPVLLRYPNVFVRLLTLLSALVFCLYASAHAQKHPPSHPIDINTATAEQLQQLPGIGPATAKAVIRFREKSGPFRRPEDLLAIHGISKSRFDKLRPYITVTPPRKPHS
jgi:competence ComEA-like helix-hairpin-helix protein